MELRKTHIYDFHAENGNIVDFGGFAMPVWYEGIIPEHNAVREGVGIFDTCHMGRTMAVGPDTERWLNRMVTNNVSNLELNGGIYSVMCRPHGGIVDDLIIYKMADDRYYIVYNAGTRPKDFAWFKETSEGYDVELTDHSDDIAMLAVQGPRAVETVNKVTSEDVSMVPRFSIKEVTIAGYPGYVTRTGYTGEDGFEVYVLDSPLEAPGKALDVWNKIVDAGAKPCGLGSRDSLRLEAGLNLYGSDIDEETNPLEAKLRWVVKFKKPGGFIGREAIIAAREAGLKKSQVGIAVTGRGIPRHGYEILDGAGEEVLGVVTSGGLAPTLGYGIALGYVPPGYSKRGTELKIRVRKRFVDGKVVKAHPFYDDSVYGWKRDVQ